MERVNNGNFKKEIIKEGGDIMAVLAKPINVAFVVKESEAQQFLSHKKGSNKQLESILKKAKKIEGNIVHKE